MDRLFIDTNVLLDVVQKRPDFVVDSLAVLKHAHGGAALAAVSALSLSDIAYILRRKELAQLKQFYKQLRDYAQIAPLADTEVDQAIASKFTDFEDALQWQAAKSWDASHLITRNADDFPKHSNIRVLSPRDYLGLGSS